MKPFMKNPLAFDQEMPWNASGDKHDFAVRFYKEKFHNYSSSNAFQPLNGILVIINSPDEFSTQSGHHMIVGNDIYVDALISLEIMEIADELKFWEIENRNCFLPGEKKLHYFRIYTKSNCEQECLSNVSLETCGCVPFYLIRTNLCL